MRVIGGTAGSLPLKSVKGLETRPTQDRIKETLFNMLSPYIYGSSFLDLFAGSGGIGIEALSRGAKYACFADRSKEAAACIRDNLRFTKLAEKAEVLECDCSAAISRLEGRGEAFDIIFMDPPYRMGLEKEMLEALSGSCLVSPETVLIFEASLDTDISWLDEYGFTVMKDKRYKSNRHVWVRRKEAE